MFSLLFDKLNQNQRYKLLNQEFTISMDNSRMGYKLQEILENNLPQILTSVVFQAFTIGVVNVCINPSIFNKDGQK